MKELLSLSICVPAFNEEKNIKPAVEDLLSVLPGMLKKLEIIIVDDASTDSTPQLAAQLAKEHAEVKVIRHHKNSGIGACYRDALAVATGDYYTWFPADHENSSDEFVQCLPFLSQDTIVICHHQGLDPRSIMRRMISRTYTRVLNRLFHLNLKYYNGLTIFPAAALRSFSLAADGFFFLAESLIKADRRGYRIVELAAALKKRNYGKSKALSLFAIKQMSCDILRILLRRRKD